MLHSYGVCTGVRQAVALVTSMEHSLAWERSLRQQAEEDVHVLLEVTDAMERADGATQKDYNNMIPPSTAEVTSSKGIRSTEAMESALKKTYAGNAGRKE